jgi:hypothetical protein
MILSRKGIVGDVKSYLLALMGIAALAAAPASAEAAAPSCVPSWASAHTWSEGDAAIDGVSSDGEGDAFAVGEEYIVDKAYVPFSVRWSGTAWEHVDVPSPGGVSSLLGVSTLSADNAWAVGDYAKNATLPTENLVYEWNGTKWTKVSVPNWANGTTKAASTLYGAAAASTSVVWAVGSYTTSSGTFAGIVEGSAGGAWSLAAAPTETGTLYGVAASSSKNAWAVGQAYQESGGTYTFSPLIEHFNGTSWTVSSAPTVGADDTLQRVTIVSPKNVWAVGGNSTGGLALHWNGKTWSSVTLPADGSLAEVYALGADDVWGVGALSTSANSQPLIEHWNGTAWSVVPGAITEPSNESGALSGIAYSGGHLLAVGYQYPNGTNAPSNIGEQICPMQVGNSGFDPTVAKIALGQEAWWTVAPGSASHSVTDDSGLGLFDSGLIQPGSAFDQTFDVAGGYTITDSATGHTAQLVVPVAVSPSSGTTSTPFTLSWAATAPTGSYEIDVEVQRPGSSSWVNWSGSPTGSSGTAFTPDAGPGTYRFRARLYDFADQRSSGWSAPATFTVS